MGKFRENPDLGQDLSRSGTDLMKKVMKNENKKVCAGFLEHEASPEAPLLKLGSVHIQLLIPPLIKFRQSIRGGITN